MKKIHLIRHAKSSWADGSMADIERPLNNRGLKACRTMAPKMVEAGCPFEHIFCSPAVRAQSTIENLSQALAPRKIEWQIDQALYTFEAPALLTWFQGLDNVLSEVVVIGHNQAITDFCNGVGDRRIDNVPTCGYAQLAFDGSAWQDLSAGAATLVTFLWPKMF